MRVNEFTSLTTASMHVRVWLWLNNGLVWCECWNDEKLQYLTTGIQQHCSSSLCVVLSRMLPHTSLPMIHAMLTLSVKVFLLLHRPSGTLFWHTCARHWLVADSLEMG